MRLIYDIYEEVLKTGISKVYSYNFDFCTQVIEEAYEEYGLVNILHPDPKNMQFVAGKLSKHKQNKVTHKYLKKKNLYTKFTK